MSGRSQLIRPLLIQPQTQHVWRWLVRDAEAISVEGQSGRVCLTGDSA